jgi:hypothetical protein
VLRAHLSVEETDEVIGLARYTTWLVGDSYTGNVLPLVSATRRPRRG